MHARSLALAIATMPILLFAACGGAGLDPGADLGDTPTSSKMEGAILDVDGETALVSGVAVTLAETGERVISDANGKFSFPDLPEGDLTLSLDAAVTAFATNSAADLRDQRRDATDECDRRDHQIHIRQVQKGESISLELRLEEGRIFDVRIFREAEAVPDYWKRELEIELWRTPRNPDPDMEGELELSLDSNGCQEFEIEIEDATDNLVLEAFVITPDGDEESLGSQWVEPDGDAEWRLDTCDGDALPFGVDSLLELEFHRIVVRDQMGVAMMRCRIPELPPYDHCFRIRGAARLRKLAPPVGGYVIYTVAGCTGKWLHQRFEIGAHDLDEGQEVEFYLEDPDFPGTLVSIGTLLANEDGIARLVFNTSHGDELPHGVATLRPLVGMEIQVRDDVTGERLLIGHVPEPLED